MNVDDVTHYSQEYISTLEAPGVPPHVLELKRGAVVIVLRNLNKDNGLVNGTRLIVQEVNNGRLLKGVIATGVHKGKVVLIPKIPLKPADSKAFGLEWERIQFPVKLAFCMTINKAQGQSLKKVAVWLENPCFGHGQLYVAILRVGCDDDIKLFIGKVEGYPKFTTRNVVYHELIEE